jgi:hypothetical protein
MELRIQLQTGCLPSVSFYRYTKNVTETIRAQSVMLLHGINPQCSHTFTKLLCITCSLVQSKLDLLLSIQIQNLIRSSEKEEFLHT